MAVKVHLDHVGMAFTTPGGTFRAVAPLNLSIESGRFVSLVGPSGCGKSTLFNIIAGLLAADRRPRADRRRGRHRHHRPRRLHAAEGPAAAVAHGARQRHPRHGDPGQAAQGGARAGAAAVAEIRPRRLRVSLSQFAVRRHAPARGAVAHTAVRHRRDPARRAVRRARRADQAADAGMADAALERLQEDRGVRHPRRRGGDLPVRRNPRHGHAAGPRPRIHSDHAAASARSHQLADAGVHRHQGALHEAVGRARAAP